MSEPELRLLAGLLRSCADPDFEIMAARLLECGVHPPTDAEVAATSESIRAALAPSEPRADAET